MNVDKLLGTPPTTEAHSSRAPVHLRLTNRARSRLITVMTPELAKLIRSNDVTSNIFAEEYADKLAAQMIDTAVARFDA